MATYKRVVRLRQNSATPEQHLWMAESLFYSNIDFDYFPNAIGYKVTPVEEDPCETEVELLENEGGHPGPAVECFAGLVMTSSRALQATLKEIYAYNLLDGDYNFYNLTELKVGDVISLQTIEGSYEVGKKSLDIIPDGRIIPYHYEHSMFVATPPEVIKENSEWSFWVFHSQRENIGPEYSKVNIRFGKEDHEKALFVQISSVDNDRFEILTQTMSGGYRHLQFSQRTLHISGIYRAYETTCVEVIVEEKPPRQDPLVFDLFGDGIHTIGTDAELHFDHNGDGFGELTGWVDWGSGMLMLDHNGNGMLDDGSELFGDNTILPDGTVAADGFAALAFYDANGDGRIDADDPIWSDLRMWQGQFSNLGHIGDPHEQGVLSTLDELGIAAINLDYTDTNIADEAGNTEIRSGGFVWADGSSGDFAEYSFDTDMSDTVLVNVVEVSSEISALPQLFGAGTLRDLHQAMALESDGELRALLEAFAAETDVEARSVIFLDLLYEWTG